MTALCTHTQDAPAWTLGALAAVEAENFAAHLEQCKLCQAETESLMPAAEVLAMAAPQIAPPDVLRDRIMSTVRAEAELLRATGAEADRPPAKAKRGFFSGLRPVLAGVVACVLLALGVAAGVLMDGGGDSSRPTSTFSAEANQGMSALATVSGDHVTLHMDGMKQPPTGRVYQVWLQRGDEVVPTGSLFMPSGGKATVAVEEDLAGADRVMISDEPMGGSKAPTGEVCVDAKLS